MMMKFTGRGVYGAVAVGKISVFRRQDIRIVRETVTDPAAQLERLAIAKRAALEQLQEIGERALREVGEENAAIFEIHRMMMEDEDYHDAIAEMITVQRVSAEYAVSAAGEQFAGMFAAMDDAYMQERAADVRDISNRIIRCLQGTDSTDASDGAPMILCADDLAPSEAVTLDKRRVLAIVTVYGSPNSHTAILARSMNIPAVIGVGEDFLAAVHDGDTAVVNGFTGECILHPDAPTVADAEQKCAQVREKDMLLRQLRGKDNITLDGRRIRIYANIGSADQIGEVLANDAGGIGLFRSEFLYLEQTQEPSEEAQYRIYKRVLERLEGRRVIIRTLDIGADKQCGYLRLPKEENPALGIRAIRLCLNRPELFRTQLRALLRASVHGKLGIMFPMITSVWELEEILALYGEVKAQLQREGIGYADDTELGIMIETPAAALISDRLAPMVDFFSVGTNDLIQYTLACDRQNPAAERFCDPRHEAVLKLIAMAAEQAHRHGKWIGICGELAADTALTEAFLRMGIDELSVSPAFVLKVRKAVRSIDLSGNA